MNWIKAVSSSFRAEITVRTALLTVHGSGVCVALCTDSVPGLPRKSGGSGESLDRLARTSVSELIDKHQFYLEQLYTFSFERREIDEIVVSYLALTSTDVPVRDSKGWQAIADAYELVDQTDRLILEYALVRLRAKIGYTTIAFELMPETFTLGELQQTYESILSRPLDPRNFRRRMVSSGLLQSENRQRRDVSHRPATLYRFSGAHDPASYLTPLTDTGGISPVTANGESHV